jgi:hypothetical protein
MANLPHPPENSTLVARIEWYVERGRYREAKALATLGDLLEECFSWDVEFEREAP